MMGLTMSEGVKLTTSICSATGYITVNSASMVMSMFRMGMIIKVTLPMINARIKSAHGSTTISESMQIY